MSHSHRTFVWIALLGTALSSGALAQGWSGGKAPEKPAAVEQLSESDQARYGAALNFELNDANKIVYSSCWVHESLGLAEPVEIPAIFELED